MLLRTAVSKKDYQQIHALYKSAFPIREQTPFILLKHQAQRQKGMFLMAEEDHEFLGFLHIIVYQDLVYLFFFAMDDDCRDHGYGSEALELLHKRYPGKKVLLARETLDPSSHNYEERMRRYAFYCRNGYTDLPCTITEGGITFDTMSYGGNVEPEEYNQLVRSWVGPWLAKVTPMHMKRK